MKQFLAGLMLGVLVLVTVPALAVTDDEVDRLRLRVRTLEQTYEILDMRIASVEFQAGRVPNLANRITVLEKADLLWAAEWHALQEWRLRRLTATGVYTGPIQREQIETGSP